MVKVGGTLSHRPVARRAVGASVGRCVPVSGTELVGCPKALGTLLVADLEYEKLGENEVCTPPPRLAW